MFLKKYLFLTLLALASIQTLEANRCEGSESCLTDPGCLCYCSRVCGFREKQSNDEPVYVEGGNLGITCFCKPWDRDNFTLNCTDTDSE